MSSLIRSIKAIAILDHDGNRVLAKYYDATYPTLRNNISCVVCIGIVLAFEVKYCTHFLLCCVMLLSVLFVC